MNSKYSKEALAGYVKNKQQTNLTPYNALASQYADIVREPTAVDALAGDFQNMADAYSPQGPANQSSKAVLGGFGAGLQGYANEQRREKLSPALEEYDNLRKITAMLQQQMLEQEGQEMQTRQFFEQNSVPIAELSKASLAGDTNAANQIAQGILRNYKQAFQDPSVGDFDHYHNGTVYFENLETGTVEGRNIVQLMYQSGVDPVEMFGQDAPVIEAGLSPGAKMLYENTMQANKYALENAGLQNQKLQSDIDLNNSKSQVPKVNEHLQNKIIDNNLKYLDTKDAEIGQATIKNEVLDKLKSILENESAAGGTPLDALNRWGKKVTGNDKNLSQATMLQKYFFKDIKGVAGNPNQKEWEDLVSRLISADKNVDATLQMIDFEKEQNNNAINNYDTLREILEENDYSLLYNDPKVTKEVKARIEALKDTPKPSTANNGKDIEKKWGFK